MSIHKTINRGNLITGNEVYVLEGKIPKKMFFHRIIESSNTKYVALTKKPIKYHREQLLSGCEDNIYHIDCVFDSEDDAYKYLYGTTPSEEPINTFLDGY